MRKAQAIRTGWAWVVALLFSGCMSQMADPIPVGGQSITLTTASKGLRVVERDVWEDAPAGCEGRLEPGLKFALAEGTGLLVALDGDEVLCVDTLLAIEAELEEEGQPHAAATLHTAYARTAPGLGAPIGDPQDPSPQPNLTDSTSGDPSPQPNRPGSGTVSYDPDRGGDPSPQPNTPTVQIGDAA